MNVLNRNICMIMTHNTLYITILATLIGCTGQEQNTVSVEKVTDGTITVDGYDTDWDTSPQVTGLVDPWHDAQMDQTRFLTCSDNENLYLLYKVHDEHIYCADGNEERSVDYCDRIEFFICKDEQMNEYYCLEIDPNGKVMDYRAAYHRNFDYGWTCDIIDVGTSISNNEYLIEAAIPLEWLKENCFISDSDEIIFGIYRADRRNKDDSVIDWYTWIDPGTPGPEFHVPGTLGKLIL